MPARSSRRWRHGSASPPSEFASHPHAFFGSVEQICEQLLERRERFGVSYVTVAQRHLDEFAPSSPHCGPVTAGTDGLSRPSG